MQKIRFIAIIEKQGSIDAAFIRFPYDVQALFGTRGQVKVNAVFDGEVNDRGSLANMGQGCPVLGLTKNNRQQPNKTFGDNVNVVIGQDIVTREVNIPSDAQDLLGDNPFAGEKFYSLSYTHKKEYISWIESAKKPETRTKRLEKLIDQLSQQKPVARKK